MKVLQTAKMENLGLILGDKGQKDGIHTVEEFGGGSYFRCESVYLLSQFISEGHQR
jgi:hypothetical protein